MLFTKGPLINFMVSASVVTPESILHSNKKKLLILVFNVLDVLADPHLISLVFQSGQQLAGCKKGEVFFILKSVLLERKTTSISDYN